MNRFFEFVLPKFLRRRQAMREDARLSHLAGLHDDDATLRAVLELAHEQLEEEIKTLLQNDLGKTRSNGQTRDGGVQLAVSTVLGSGPMEYQRGRAASLYYFLLRIESERESAREEMAARAKRMEEDAKKRAA